MFNLPHTNSSVLPRSSLDMASFKNKTSLGTGYSRRQRSGSVNFSTNEERPPLMHSPEQPYDYPSFGQVQDYLATGSLFHRHDHFLSFSGVPL